MLGDQKDSSPRTYLSPQKSPQAAISMLERTELGGAMQAFVQWFQRILCDLNTKR